MDKFVVRKGSAPAAAAAASCSSSAATSKRQKKKVPEAASKRQKPERKPWPWLRCPVCNDLVAESTMVDHMTSPACVVAAVAVPAPSKTVSGLRVYEDFVSEAEETALLDWLETGERWKPGSFNGPTLRKAWGVRTDLGRRCFKEPETAMPPQFEILVGRMRAHRELAEFTPNEANALDYRRALGHHLNAHCDDRRLSGSVLVNLSLAGDATMTYTLDDPGKKRKSHLEASHRVLLRRRSLQVQSGSVRYDYSHGIAHSDLHDDRRVSITFRMNLDAKAHPHRCTQGSSDLAS